ncbi:4-hydroxythreonine-4-phosphate dehydrogenase PdxA [Amorphus orientalis]|uniref:4-hydroxythreonine-4-phosphate dehydrogenase n=1 Tax=Amorphus orientalis TaxID=649198 RepID=A0AAE3VN60_9HYPH|nr:4-hydroxythreonine-4-phosphate dehydrogenase PdxA [Amorphus orientalis]MDQ0315624.1 4-hydroxythreonine-4-phosphate dehydrogenase [Amorphus orientalis]
MLDRAHDRQPAPLAVTLGEPAGIGPDLALMAWSMRDRQAVPPFFVAGDPEFLARRAEALGLDVRLEVCSPSEAVALFGRAIPVVSLDCAVAGVPGAPSGADAAAVIGSIDRAVTAVHAGEARAVVTSPIHKKSLYGANFTYPGHTEYLGALAEHLYKVPATPIMMLAGPQLRTVPVTVHIPLRDVPNALTSDMIVTTGRIVDADLRDRFGIPAPRIAVTGLNPHAGEGGALGSEDEAVIAPAIARLKDEGLDVRGPFPADAIFSARARAGYDVVLAMYHDQALIPVKTLAFDETVNVTLGLPFVRTSPDHGTAFDLAATGRAGPESFLAALAMADGMSTIGTAPADLDE